MTLIEDAELNRLRLIDQLGGIMELKELAQKCIENISWCNKHNMTPVLSLSVRAGKSATRKYSKPFGSSGPSGKIVEWGSSSGQDICIFSTIDLLAFLVANGVVSVEQAAQHNVQPTDTAAAGGGDSDKSSSPANVGG